MSKVHTHWICRRVGQVIFEHIKVRPKSRIFRPLGEHAHKRKKQLTAYGKQLKFRQIVRFFYGGTNGLTASSLHKLYEEASKKEGVAQENLVNFLERRLQTVVSRGWGISRDQARQMICHRHILVNQKVVNKKGYRVSLNDAVTFSNALLKTKLLSGPQFKTNTKLPVFLSRIPLGVQLISMPNLSNTPLPFEAAWNDLIGIYSR
jgi:small subunit ribosomal protein S4